MKKIILILLTVLLSTLITNAQSYYKATITEMYTYDYQSQKWTLYQKNSDVNITVVLEDDFISIQANKPTMYRVYKNTGTNISGESFQGFRYEALDLRENTPCSIDVIKFTDANYLISIIRNDNVYNLRYYIIMNYTN